MPKKEIFKGSPVFCYRRSKAILYRESLSDELMGYEPVAVIRTVFV